MREQYDLPLNKDITARFVPKIVALMVYLGTLCFVFTLFMVHSSLSWHRQLTTHLSIELPTNAVESRALNLLKETPGVAQATPVPQKEMASLFRNLLGQDIDIDLFALPAVVDVSLKAQEPFDLEHLEKALTAISPQIHVTDHRSWQTQVANLINTSVLATFVITVLIGAGAIASALFATKTSLLIHKQVIEILNLIGATNAYIAKQFQMHALKQALIASAIGSALAFLTFFGLINLLERAELPCMLDSSFFTQTLFVFIGVPILMALLMMFAVRYSVMKALRS